MKRNLWSKNLPITPVRIILTGVFVGMFLLTCSHRPAPVQEAKLEPVVVIPFLGTYRGTWDDPAWGKGDLTVVIGNTIKDPPRKHQIIFKLKWEEVPNEYVGWISPPKPDGSVDGLVDCGGDMYTFVFKGTINNGILKASHFNVADEATKCGEFEVRLANKH